MTYAWNTTTDLYRSETAKCAPENHRDLQMGERENPRDTTKATVWCPWAYATVRITATYEGLPTCNGCGRPIDVLKLGYVVPPEPATFKAYAADGLGAKEAILGNAATRAAKSLSQWKGHMLSPATRKADRKVTYETMLKDIVFAVLMGSGVTLDEIDALSKRILAEFLEVKVK